jgi:succinate-acetate transporter protein
MAKNDRNSFGKRLSRFVLVISAFSLGLKLYLDGFLSVEKFAIFMLVAVIASVIDSVIVKVILTLFGIGFYLLQKADYNNKEFLILAVQVGGIIVMLFGFFVMFGGLNKKK